MSGIEREGISATDVLVEMEEMAATLRVEYARRQERAAAVVAAAEETRERLETWERAIAMWREAHPEARVSSTEVPGAAAELFERFRNRSTREMLIDLARENHGVLVIKEAGRRLAAAGLFKDEANAAKNVSTTISRSEDIFEWIGRGRYRLADPAVSVPATPSPPSTPPADSQPAETEVGSVRSGHRALSVAEQTAIIAGDPYQRAVRSVFNDTLVGGLQATG